MIHFDEKGGKSREIPVRHDLEAMIFGYLDAAGLRSTPKDSPLFRTACKKTGKLTRNALYVVDVCRMVKRRLPWKKFICVVLKTISRTSDVNRLDFH